METGRRRDEVTGQIVPAHYINELRIELNGQPIVKGLLSTAVSRNPYFSFRLSNAKPGDLLRVFWADNLGHSEHAEASVGANVE